MSWLSDLAPAIGVGAGALLGGPGGAALGYLGGMISQREGQREANQQNVQLTWDQMAFQERMSSTAHQREVEDLKKLALIRFYR